MKIRFDILACCSCHPDTWYHNMGQWFLSR